MKHGFIRAAAAVPRVRVADCPYNAKSITEKIFEAADKKAEIIVFPELCVTGYTCGDLFLQGTLLSEALTQIINIANDTKELNIISIIGIPFSWNGKLYNTAAVLYKGNILGIVPKTNIPNYAEFYEKRHFAEPPAENISININGCETVFGTKLLFRNNLNRYFTFAIEICEDLWAVLPPSANHALAGAGLILNLSANNEVIGKEEYRRSLVSGQSARCMSAYVYSSAGEGESTTDLVFSGNCLISENGTMLSESRRLSDGIIYADLDMQYIDFERRRSSSFNINTQAKGYNIIPFDMEDSGAELERQFDRLPFVPSGGSEINARCEEILYMQSIGLKKRIEHMNSENVVLAVSGGLDSTLALLVAVRTFDTLKLDRKGITTVTMPCFGTTGRTYNNAISLMRGLNTSDIEIDIKQSVLTHFEAIGHDPSVHNLVYENAQARERMQVVMDIAAKKNGCFVIGTGDMSELALGFTTYNGDHMSMYGVNCSIPKTLLKHLIKYVADNEYSSNTGIRNTLYDILDTPVSPELLPPDGDTILQITEEFVGPYELHDFFMYYMLRRGYEPEKIFYLAKAAFNDLYNGETIIKWMKVFYSRFFSQQFKRSCIPDGPKIGSVALSPRGDWRMPSDASVKIWMDRIEALN